MTAEYERLEIHIIVRSFLRNRLEGCNGGIQLDTEIIFRVSTAFVRDICPSDKYVAK